MKTGFNLLLWTTHVTDAHFPLFEKLKAAGYDGVEIPLFEGSVAHFEEVGRAIRDNGLGCTTVTILPDAAHSAISPATGPRPPTRCSGRRRCCNRSGCSARSRCGQGA